MIYAIHWYLPEFLSMRLITPQRMLEESTQLSGIIKRRMRSQRKVC